MAGVGNAGWIVEEGIEVGQGAKLIPVFGSPVTQAPKADRKFDLSVLSY